jgi:glyoxylase-like metal-dependent hydrolase (beta-lactamase superfamily II)
MTAPADLQFVSEHLAIWNAFDPSIKADLFSTAISTINGTALIDPIPICPDGLADLQARSPIIGIIVTNQNHWRAAAHLSQQLSIPIFAHPDAPLEQSPSFTAVGEGDRLHDILEVIRINGAAPGEIAIFSELENGTLIVGDALINFEPYGFTLLPPKYCDNHHQMRKSLRQLTDRQITRIFFAHGMPILSGADSRVRALLDSK